MIRGTSSRGKEMDQYKQKTEARIATIASPKSRSSTRAHTERKSEGTQNGRIPSDGFQKYSGNNWRYGADSEQCQGCSIHRLRPLIPVTITQDPLLIIKELRLTLAIKETLCNLEKIRRKIMLEEVMALTSETELKLFQKEVNKTCYPTGD